MIHILFLFVLMCMSAYVQAAPAAFSQNEPLPSGAQRWSLPMTTSVEQLLVRVERLGTDVQHLLADVKGIQVLEDNLEIRIILESDLLFDFDRWNIRSDAEASLRLLAGALQQFSGQLIRLEGHTDSKGTDEYNLRLSTKRADSVMRWLLQHPDTRGLQFSIDGKGESAPVRPNSFPNGDDDPVGRQANRRVEIRIRK